MTEENGNSLKHEAGTRYWLRPQSLRRYFTADQIWDRVKTLAWVIPVTMLIWVYAEREQVVPEPGFVFPIEVKNADPSRVVTLEAPLEKIVTVTLEAPRSRLERMKDVLASRGNSLPLVLDVDAALPAGEHQLRTLALLSNHSLFKDAGVKVVSAQPSFVRVDVDEMQETLVPVEVPPNVDNLEPGTSFRPAEVKVRGPKKTLRSRADAGQLRVYADLKNLPALKTPGEKDEEGVPLVLATGGRELTISPSTVRATLRVREADVPDQLDTVTIIPQIPDKIQKNYVVVWSSGLAIVNNVKIKGPKKEIDALKADPGKAGYYAVLKISPDLVPNQEYTQPLEFSFPGGIHLDKTAEPYTVKFKLVERGGAE